MRPLRLPPSPIPPSFTPLSILLSPLLILLLLFSLTTCSSLPFPLHHAPSPSSCTATFADIDALTDDVLAFRTVAYLCPPNCLLSPTPSQPPLVQGSYPYSPASSICLSAIHSGLLSPTAGGSVFVSRFYRNDWSNTSSQSIYPYTSAQPSTSNGVSSQAVPPTSYTVPSTAEEFSYTVRGRGELVRQRRLAPFPPRSGHLHVAFPDYSLFTFSLGPRTPYPDYHLIMGGYNSTAYLNDVWVAESTVMDDNADVSWRRLPDAPFTPRSDMRAAMFGDDNGAFQLLTIYILGGQTSHACDLYRLGVCSAEVWSLTLNITVPVSTVPYRFTVTSYTWAVNASSLPFTSRCGFALLDYESGSGPFVLAGGQLSYADSTCTSPPLYTNEVYISSFKPTKWTPDVSNGSFSPRRGQLREDALATSSRQAQHLRGISPIAGGSRILNLTTAGGITQIGAVEVFADVWVCQVDISRWPVTCQWGWPGSPINVSTTTVPLPVALGASAASRGLYGIASQRFTGFTAADAISDWTASSAGGQWTSMLRSVPEWGFTATEVAQQRDLHPISYILTDELQDPTSSYYVGSQWIQSHSPWVSPPHTFLAGDDLVLPSSSTLHPQSYNLALSPAEASAWLPQPASCEATSRPFFRFPLQRLDSGYSEWSDGSYDENGWLKWRAGRQVVSGGRSASQYFNDWIEVGETRCLPPDDPSFLPLLGPVQWYTVDEPDPVDVSFGVQRRVTVACQRGYHFEPAVPRDSHATMFCAPNGLWLDFDLLTWRSCRPNPPLTCQPPLVDLGGKWCEPPRPTVSALSAPSTLQESPVTLTGFPVIGDVPLRILGSAFTRPLSVTVGGHLCDSPQLSGPQVWVCYNTSCAVPGGGDDVTLQCGYFADAIACIVPAVLGLNLPVIVTSGLAGYTAEVTNGGVASISSTAPIITYLTSDEGQCNRTADYLHLWNCPIQVAYSIAVCLYFPSVYNLSLVVSFGALTTPLTCEEVNYNTTRPPAGYARCLRCVVQPFVGTQQLRVQPKALSLQSRTDAGVSSRPCPPGYNTNYERTVSGQGGGEVCVPCGKGQSTEGIGGAPACVPCRAGEYANASAQSTCHQCAVGRYASEPGADHCDLCPVNSYQPTKGNSRCLTCEAGEYMVYGADSNATRAIGTCALCPPSATCDPSGNITAALGSFLVIDQEKAHCRHLLVLPRGLCTRGSVRWRGVTDGGDVVTAGGQLLWGGALPRLYQSLAGYPRPRPLSRGQRPL